MSAQPSSQGAGEKRKAFRCPVYPPDHKAKLLINEAEVPARLIDESATGFGIRTNRPPGLEPEDVVRLETAAGLHEVGVTYVAPEIPAQWDPAVPDGQGPTFRVGLKRLKEVIFAETVQPWFRRIGLSRLIPSSIVLLSTACMLVLALVVGGVIAVILTWHPQSRPARSSTAGEPSTIQWLLDRQAKARPAEKPPAPSSPPAAESRKPDDGPEATSLGASLGEHASQLGNTIRKLPGAAAFALSDVARDLGLDDEQRQRIRAIVEAADEAVRELAEQQESNRQHHAQDRAALLEEAYQRALDVLTPEQRARWEALQE